MIGIIIALAPLLFFFIAFLITMYFLCRGAGITKLRDIMSIFLKEPATLKTWGLFLAAPSLCLMLNSTMTQLGNNEVWPREVVVALARIAFFEKIALGLEILLSIVLGAFGAVAFKGQLPGGASVSLSQDPTTGATTGTATGPASPSPPVPPAGPARPE